MQNKAIRGAEWNRRDWIGAELKGEDKVWQFSDGTGRDGSGWDWIGTGR